MTESVPHEKQKIQGIEQQAMDQKFLEGVKSIRLQILTELLHEFEGMRWNAKCRKMGVAHIENKIELLQKE